MSDIKRPTLLENMRNLAGLPQLVENRDAMRNPEEARQAGMSSGMDDVASNQYNDDQADARSAQDEDHDKNVDWDSMEVDGIDRKDHPDYSDAYYSAGKYKDGSDIDSDNLDDMSDRHGDKINAHCNDSMHESVKSSARLAEMATIRKLAGLPLFEAHDDDDEDADVAAADREIAKQKKAGGKAAKGWEQAEKAAKKTDADKDVEAAKPVAKAEPEAKPAAKVEPKAATTPAEETPHIRKAFRDAIRAVLKINHNATLGDVRAYCAEHNITMRSHPHSHLSSIRKGFKVTECYILVHPQMSGFVLAENVELNRYQWIDAGDTSTSLDVAVFESATAAEAVAKYVKDYRSQATVLTKIDLS